MQRANRQRKNAIRNRRELIENLEHRFLMSGTPLLTPTSFQVSAAIFVATNPVVDLTWTDPNIAAGVPAANYTFTVSEALNHGSFTPIAYLASNFNSEFPIDEYRVTVPQNTFADFEVQAVGQNPSGIAEASVTTPLLTSFAEANASGSSIVVNWTPIAGVASYTVTNALTHQPITTTTATSFTDTNTVPGQTKAYTVEENLQTSTGLVQGPASSVVYAATASSTPINDSAGFAAAGGSLNTSNAAITSAGNLLLTNDSSALTNTAFSTAKFDTTFSFTLIPPSQGDFGSQFAFVLQGISAPIQSVPSSLVIPFNFGPVNYLPTTTQSFNTTGCNLINNEFIDMTGSNVFLRNGDQLQVHLNYDGTTLTENVTDQSTGGVFNQQYGVNIPLNLGSTAYAGFTGAAGAGPIPTGMQASVLNWTFTPPDAVVATPVKLTGNPIGTTQTWTPGSNAAKVFDGNLNTYFDPANGNLSNWVGLDLGSPASITQISYAPRPGYEFRMYGGQFQVSSTADFSADVHTLYTIPQIPSAGKLTTVTFPSPGAYRYVRYTGGTQWVNIAEMQVFGSPHPLTGTPIGVGGAFVPTSSIAQAFDGKLNTYFDPANGNLTNWVGLDLGTAQTITQIKFAARSGYEFRMYGAQIQVSSTADFSSDVHTIYTITTIPPAHQLVTVAISPVSYRYIRYIGGSQWVNIAELELDGV